MQRQITRNLALFAPSENRIKILVRTNRSMRIVTVSGELPETRVVIGHIGWHEGVCGLDSRYPLEPEFLDQSVLHRKMRPLDTPLGRRRVRADAVNVEFEECPPKLRMTVATR